MTNTWRFLDTGPCSAAFNMALDEAIAVSVRKEHSPPTLRLYGWDIPSVSIGYFQKISDIDVQFCIRKHIPLVRRPTGGRAILHGNEITYGFSAKTTSDLFSKGLFDSYKKLSSALGLALSRIGVPAELNLARENRRSTSSVLQQKNPICFQSTSYGEITMNRKKIIGSAQKRWIDGLLQQGSIPFIIDEDDMISIFRLNTLHGMKKSFIGLQEMSPDLDIEEMKDAIRISFEEIFGVRLDSSSPSGEEISLARELEDRKYLSHEWNFRR